MTYLIWWIWTRRYYIKRRWQLSQRSKRDQVVFEQIIVYDEDIEDTYRVALPVSELYEHLGAAARYICDSRIGPWLGAGITSLSGLVLVMLPSILVPAAGQYIAIIPLLGPFIFGFLAFFAYNLVVSMFFALLLSPLFAAPGWWLGQRFSPKPQWLATKKDGDISPFDLDDYFSQDNPEASFLAEFLQQRDIRLVLSGGQSKTQQLQLAATVTLVVCLVVALFFFVTVFQGG